MCQDTKVKKKGYYYVHRYIDTIFLLEKVSKYNEIFFGIPFQKSFE